jgi:hypothetical protein
MEDPQLLFCLNMQNEASKTSVLSKWTDTDWKELIRQSERHSVSAYLNHRLKAFEPTLSIPTPVDQRLREMTLQNASRNIRLYHELGKTLKSLKDAGISVILLKGAYLAEAVYDNISLRTMCDVDILVKKDDLHKTITYLFQYGFSVTNEDRIGHLGQTTEIPYHILPEQKHFFGLTHPKWPVKLDVHISLDREYSPFTVETEGLWEKAMKIEVDGANVLALSPVDSILYQCMHASFQHHFLFGLRPLIDISETIRRYQNELNWKELQNRARAWNAQRCVWLTLRFARELLGAGVPRTLLSALKPENMDMPLLEWARNTIFSDKRDLQILSDDVVKLLKSRSLRNRVALLFKSVFLSRQMLATMYPASPNSKRIYLYYAVRVKDLFLRWGRVVWRHLVHDKKTMSMMESEKRRVDLEQWLTSVD